MRTIYQILLIIGTIFVLYVCDNRDAINPSENAEAVIQLMLSENSGNYTISLSDDYHQDQMNHNYYFYK